MTKDELKDWARRHGFEQSARSSKVFIKGVRQKLCKDGIEREIRTRIVFKDKVIRIERSFYYIEDYYEKTIVEMHWARLRSGYYSQLSINPVNDQLEGLK